MKAIVAYFSAGGTTAKLAGKLAEATGGELFEIRPVEKYTEKDVNWKNPLARCNREKFGKKDVPLEGKPEGLSEYDTVFVGFPIWYYGAPNVIQTFFKENDLKGKKIALFATSGGSDVGKTVEKLSSEIQDRIISEGIIKDAQVTTKIMSFKVTVLGAVSTPGTQEFSGERLTLLEAIGRCGDLTNSAIRKRVLVVREENGERRTYTVDLTDPQSVFNSPAYYMHQNDIVYVEPNGSEKVKGSTGYQYLGLTTSLLGMGTSIASLIIALTK